MVIHDITKNVTRDKLVERHCLHRVAYRLRFSHMTLHYIFSVVIDTLGVLDGETSPMCDLSFHGILSLPIQD